MKKRIIKKLICLFFMLFIFSFSNYSYVSAEKETETEVDGDRITGDQYRKINNDDRNAAYTIIINYMNQLKALYDLSYESVKNMDAVLYQMNVYVANNDMTVGELNSIISDTKSNIKEAIGDASTSPKTENFIFMSNDISIASGTYGAPCTVTVGLMNLGDDILKDIVVTPVQDVDPSKWPFVINTASDAKIISSLYPSATIEEGAKNKQLLSWTFNISEQALNGTYEIPFKVQYYRNGVLKETTIKTYAVINAKEGNGHLVNGENISDNNLSTPRIIVTGFKTDPEVVYAGDTFTLTIFVQNTSSSTAVSNIQFDLKAAATGSEGNETVDAFLPTSGSSSIYVDRIEPKSQTTLTIEMTARNDLTQKPYVIMLNSMYEGENNKAYEATADISIPVNQESKIDFSDGELSTNYMFVGDSCNIMFDIYNKGKTTLNNVQITFDDGYVYGGTAFVGKIEPGATGSVDVDVYAAMGNFDVGVVTCTITYEDQSGNTLVAQKTFDIIIDEGMYTDDMYEGEFEEIPIEDEEGANNSLIFWIAGAVILGLVIVVIIVIVVISNNVKKKRLLKELEDSDDGTLL